MEQYIRRNAFGICRLPPQVVLFLRSEQNGDIFLTHLLHLVSSLSLAEIEIQMISAISVGRLAGFNKTPTIIQRSS